MTNFNSKGMNRRQTLKLGAGALGVGALGAPFWQDTAQAQASTLRAAITGFNTINTLDPAKASLIPEFYIIYGVFNALLKFNDKMELVPDLAESYKFIDPKVLEFKLRKGVKFHNGEALTADDVKYSIERTLNEKTASPNRGKLLAISNVSVIDPLTIRIETKTPFAPLLNYLTNTRTGTQIVSRKAVETMGDEAFAKNPVGTGRYQVKEWKSGEMVELAGFAGAFEGAPKIMSVRSPMIAEESSGMTAILGNQIDLTSTAPFADIPVLEQKKEVKVLKQAGLNTRYIALNNKKAPFDDVHFRRAVSMAFDRNVLVKAVIFGEGVATPGILPPSMWPDNKPAVSDWVQFNPERAKAEFAKSKYKPGQEGTILIWGSNWWRRIGEIFVGQVNQVLGTKLSVQASDFNAGYARAKAGDYEAMVMGWLGFVDPDEFMGEMVGSKGFRNIQFYANEKMDALLEKGRMELDPVKRKLIYREAELLMLEDMPLLPCFTSNVHNLLRSNVSGFTQLPYSNFADQFGTVQFG